MIREERTCGRIGDPPVRLVLLQGALKRTHKHVALGAVVEDDAQSGIKHPLSCQKVLTAFSNISLLAANNEKAARSDLRLALKGTCSPKAGIKLFLNLIEKRLESVKIFASVAVGNLFGCTFFSG